MVKISCMILLAVLGMTGVPARASPYWVDWEGTDWPEALGYTHVWIANGPPYEPAHRTLQDGVMTIDSLANMYLCDFDEMDMNGRLDPRPGDGPFVMEWRLRVDTVVGDYDPSLAFFSDDAWALGLEFAEDRVYSVFENYLTIPFDPGVFHEYRVVSPEMRTYDLFIDGTLRHHGVLGEVFTTSYVAWGDGVINGASLTEWDWFRFGVVPEPSSGLLLGLVATLRRVHR
jgi:hypothetical protein